MKSTFWMTAQETEDELKRRDEIAARIKDHGPIPWCEPCQCWHIGSCSEFGSIVVLDTKTRRTK